jgi:hypothetical protein
VPALHRLSPSIETPTIRGKEVARKPNEIKQLL